MLKLSKMKRPDISGLKSNYFMRFQIGVICALLFALAAFNFTTYPPPEDNSITLVTVFDDEDIPVVRTASEKPKEIPPPVKVLDKIEVVEVTEALEEKPEEVPEKIEIPENAKVVFTTPIPKPPTRIEDPVKIEPEEIVPDVDEIKIIVDEMPRFDLCEELDGDKAAQQKCATQKLLQYVGKRIVYPSIARENGIKGQVVIQFVVEKDGSISNAKIARDIGAGCGAEALRVVENMPKWVPGLQRSNPVRVRFTLPVKFDFK